MIVFIGRMLYFRMFLLEDYIESVHDSSDKKEELIIYINSKDKRSYRRIQIYHQKKTWLQCHEKTEQVIFL